MPNWHEIGQELGISGSTFDIVRRKYLKKLSEYTTRNTIIYYSGWLQKSGINGFDINDSDKNGFMTAIDNLDRNVGLDIILHTPGGDIAATESIVDYLHNMFGTDIRAIIPQLAMSAGTMIACAAKEIIMGKQSSLGPIDPQYFGMSAHGILEEFNRAYSEIQEASNLSLANPNDPKLASEVQAKLAVWQPIIAKYNPTLIGECEKAIEWSQNMVHEWLSNNMFNNVENKEKIIENILNELEDHSISKSHGRHLSKAKCKGIGLNVVDLETDAQLQDLVLSVHHASIHTLTGTNAFKIIENQNGIASIQLVPNQ